MSFQEFLIIAFRSVSYTETKSYTFLREFRQLAGTGQVRGQILPALFKILKNRKHQKQKKDGDELQMLLPPWHCYAVDVRDVKEFPGVPA
ncbi:unnamed protein product [Allacma fusca]|uniref:Uncharacterized protein n=1 Tax=Allacma fusca TaxID=39272 RepID=A0A8J2KVL6_9HEXA|nr:unnamed protein product [Allacma fusca]